MAFTICSTYYTLLDKVATASANYHHATSSLQARAGRGESVQFALEMYNCQVRAEDCRRAVKALHEHESIHGCNNQDGTKPAANSANKK